MPPDALPAPLPPTVAATLRAFVERVHRAFPGRVRELRLFGSYARGEAHDDSDVDVLVLLDRAGRAERNAISDLAADLVWELHGVVVAPLAMSEEDFADWLRLERATPQAIRREGVPL